MTTLKVRIQRSPWLAWVFFLATGGVVFFLGLLASSIMERAGSYLQELFWFRRPD
jgi:nitrite reductase (cytochrome c-552)